MNIGIIIHSHTGNTLFVAEKIMQKLIQKGHTVNVERVKAVNEKPNLKEPIVLEVVPPIDEYDSVIIGSPVRGFSLSPLMKLYLRNLNSCDKIEACFVTQNFPKKWLGGNSAVKQIKKLCGQKSGGIKAAAIVNWGSNHREELIENAVNAVCEIF